MYDCTCAESECKNENGFQEFFHGVVYGELVEPVEVATPLSGGTW